MKVVHLNEDTNTSTIYYNRKSNWDDLRFPASGINPIGQASPPDVDPNDGALLFDSNSTEVIAGQAQMPHSWREGSFIVPHLHWQSVDGGAGNVLWRLDYDIANINGSFAGTFTSESIIASSVEDADIHLIKSFSPIGMTGMELSAIIKWRIARIGGDELDTYADDAKFLEFDFHYQMDSVGSGQEFIK